MAEKTAEKNLLEKLADAGEDAIGRLAKAPGGEQIAGAVHATRERITALEKRIRGLDLVETRLDQLERRVKALESSKRKPARRAASTRSSSTASKSKTPAAGS